MISRVKGSHFTASIYTVTLAIELITGRFIKFYKIPQKQGNSTAWLKILRPAENCGPY